MTAPLVRVGGRSRLGSSRWLPLPYDLSQVLVVGISSRALFDLQEEDRIFREEGLEAYSRHQIANEDRPLEPGPAFSLVEAILHLNEIGSESRLTEVVVMSRNNADTSLRLFNSIKEHGLDITRAALTSGSPLAKYAKAFELDLFLSADEEDVQLAVDSGFAAARIYQGRPDGDLPTDQLRIAFDGDAVLFSEESELVFRDGGLEAFQAHEVERATEPMRAGPFANFLQSLSVLQRVFSSEKGEEGPIRTALITARNSPAHERVIRTLRSWNVRVDETFLLGGAPKDGVVKAFGPHIFVDDQATHLEPSAPHTAVAQVPLPSSSGTQLVLDGTPPPIVKPKEKKRAKKPAPGRAPADPPSAGEPATRKKQRKKS